MLLCYDFRLSRLPLLFPGIVSVFCSVQYANSSCKGWEERSHSTRVLGKQLWEDIKYQNLLTFIYCVYNVGSRNWWRSLFPFPWVAGSVQVLPVD